MPTRLITLMVAFFGGEGEGVGGLGEVFCQKKKKIGGNIVCVCWNTLCFFFV